jgi:hypothetical protein
MVKRPAHDHCAAHGHLESAQGPSQLNGQDVPNVKPSRRRPMPSCSNRRHLPTTPPHMLVTLSPVKNHWGGKIHFALLLFSLDVRLYLATPRRSSPNAATD